MQMIYRSTPGTGSGRRHSPIALIFSASRRRASSFHWDRQAGGVLVSSVPAYRVAKSRFREAVMDPDRFGSRRACTLPAFPHIEWGQPQG